MIKTKSVIYKAEIQKKIIAYTRSLLVGRRKHLQFYEIIAHDAVTLSSINVSSKNI